MYMYVHYNNTGDTHSKVLPIISTLKVLWGCYKKKNRELKSPEERKVLSAAKKKAWRNQERQYNYDTLKAELFT